MSLWNSNRSGLLWGVGICLAIGAITGLSGCTLIPVEPDPPNPIEASGTGLLGKDTPRIRAALYAQYEEWKSVDFKEAGLSRNGVDCSGFVYLTFRDRFGVALPRNTERQAEIGFDILPRDLRAGDLVFFKTGLFDRHVGIYVENRTFLHVSQKKGVTLSSLDNPYWKKRFWQARRV